jgi:hypothetical protein
MNFSLLSLCCPDASIFLISYIWNIRLAMATTRLFLPCDNPLLEVMGELLRESGVWVPEADCAISGNL